MRDKDKITIAIFHCFMFLLVLFICFSSVNSLENSTADFGGMCGGPQNMVDLYFFYGEGCPHCAKEKPFLKKMEEKYPGLQVHSYEVWYNESNRELLKKVAAAYNERVAGVPMTFIDKKVFIGFSSERITGTEIEFIINKCITEGGCVDPFVKAGLKQKPVESICGVPEKKEKITLCAAFFYSHSCPYCQAIMPLVSQLKAKYHVDFPEYDVEGNEENKKLLNQYKKIYSIEGFSGYPIIFISDRYLVGEKQVKTYLEQEIQRCLNDECLCYLTPVAGKTPGPAAQNEYTPVDKQTVCLPVFGCINPTEMYLPVFTFLIAIVDGVNPCTMWVLSFLLSMLFYARSRKRVIFVGIVYLMTVYIVYFLFMTAWLNTFLYIGYINAIRITIGTVAVIAGIINVKDFFYFGKGISLVIPKRFKPIIIKQARNLTRAEGTALLTGTIFMAVSASLIELPCTAGFPAIYTSILHSQNLSLFMYYSYIAFYNLIYIIPDSTVLLVFLIYMKKQKKFTEKEGRWMKLIGGSIMLALGIIMLVKPELLSFR